MVHEHYESFSRGFLESFRSESCAPGRTCAASGYHSFSDWVIYCKRRFRATGRLAQAANFRNGRLLQSAGGRNNHSIGTRYRLWSLALATRRRGYKGQFTVAPDLCPDLRLPNLSSLLDA